MFKPPSLLAIQVIPTGTVFPLGSHGRYIRAEHVSLPPHAPDMLSVRNEQLTEGHSHPISLTALSAAPTRSSALGASFRLGVRVAFCCGRFPLARPLPSIPSAAGCPTLFRNFSGVGSEEARLRAGLRPPLNLHVRISRMQLLRRRALAGCKK